MRHIKLSIAIVFGVTIIGSVLSGASITKAKEQTSQSSSHLTKTTSDCTGAVSSLSQLHRSDGLLRVNRGQAYEHVATDLMAHLNSRLVLNRVDATNFIKISSSFEEEVEKFRTSYQQYERTLSSILRMDCANHPQEFYKEVNKARNERANVYQHVKKSNSLMDQYYHEFKDYRDDYITKAAKD